MEVSMFEETAPPDVLVGALRGASNTLLGAGVGAVMIIGLPVAGTVSGYKNSGVLGATFGAVGGTIAGAFIGGFVIIAGTFYCAKQLVLGIVNTPAAIGSLCSDKEWDEGIQEWTIYNLTEDYKALMNVSDEQVLDEISKGGSVASLFSSSSQEGSQNKRDTIKKNVQDTSLYDILGVDSDATPEEIRKAYYVKARANHPDKCRNDANANETFAAIGEAYQILIDDQLRAAYDAKGKEGVNNASKLDASSLFTLIFGCSKFENIIGELQVAFQVRCMTDGSSKKLSPLFLAHWQRKRELTLAHTLAHKLDIFVEGKIELFEEKANKDAEELSETLLGAVLLNVIGGVYQSQGASHLSFWDKIISGFKSLGNNIDDAVSTIASATRTVVNAMDVKSLHEKMAPPSQSDNPLEDFKKFFDFQPNPNTTMQDKEDFKIATYNMSSNMLKFSWLMTKFDVKSTIKSVCKRVLCDQSVSEDHREKRAEALVKLGSIYCSRTGDLEKGLEELLDKFGIFSGVPRSYTSPSSDQAKESSNSEDPKVSTSSSPNVAESGSNNSSTSATDLD